MDARSGLWSTGFRLAPPTTTRDLLLRPRLLAALLNRFRSRVTVVTAGPGFGKTSLLGQAVAENVISPRGIDVWLTCHPGDAVTSTLAQGLGSALETTLPASLDVDVLADAIAGEVWRRSPEHVALILDDAHLIPSDSAGANLVSAVVDRLPSNGHVLVAGRAPVPINTARLAARGELTELTETDLGFSAEEVAEFAVLRGVSDEVLSAVAPWPALAELTATTGRSRVSDFVWEEVLADMDADRRRMLAVLAAVGGADEETFGVLFDAPVDLSAVLDGLPLVSESSAAWRSLHPLWETALSGELSPPEIAAARRTQAGTLLGRGDVETAMRHFLAAEAWDSVKAVLWEVGRSTHPVVAPDVLAQWMADLPADLRQSAEGLLLAALIERSRNLSSALGVFRSSALRFREAGNPIGEFSALTHVAHISWWTDERAGLEAAVERIAELAELVPALQMRAPLGYVLLADARGEFDRALAILDRLPAAPEERDVAASVGWLRAWVSLMMGEPERARPQAETAVAQAMGTFRATGVNVHVLATWWCGDVDAAIERLPVLTDASEATGRALGRVFERSQCAALLAFTGDVTAARGHLRAAREALPGADRATMAVTTYTLAEAAVEVVRGEEGAARARLAAEVDRRPVGRPGSARVHRLFPTLTYVLVPACREQWDAAELGPATRQACDLARALVAVRQGRLPEAFDGLDLPPPGQIRAMLPLPWVVELAVAAVAAERGEGRDILAALGFGARGWIKALVTADGPLSGTARALLATLPAQPQHRLDLRMLGPWELHRDGQPVSDRALHRQRVRQLLAFLVLHPTASRARVSAALWPDLDLEDGLRNLRVTLNYAQRVLEPDRAEGDPPYFLRSAAGVLSLHADEWLSVDVQIFERLLDEAAALDRQGAPSRALDKFRAALALYRDDFLFDAPDAEWADGDRYRLRARYVTAAVRAGELLVAVGRQEEALGLAHGVLRADRWSEAGYQLLMIIHLEQDALDAAQLAHRQCLRMLAELGASPSPRTKLLEARLRTGVASR